MVRQSHTSHWSHTSYCSCPLASDMTERQQTPTRSINRPRRLRWRHWARWVNERLLLLLMPVVVVGTAVLLWHLYRQVNSLYQELAIQGTVLQA